MIWSLTVSGRRGLILLLLLLLLRLRLRPRRLLLRMSVCLYVCLYVRYHPNIIQTHTANPM